MLALASMVCKGESVRIFDLIIGEEGQRVCLRLPRGCDSIKAALYCHQNMTEEVLFRNDRFCRQMDSLGVAMIFVQSGSQDWDVKSGCQARFDSIMTALAAGSGHPELARCPVTFRTLGAGYISLEFRGVESGADIMPDILPRRRTAHKSLRLRTRECRVGPHTQHRPHTGANDNGRI